MLIETRSKCSVLLKRGNTVKRFRRLLILMINKIQLHVEFLSSNFRQQIHYALKIWKKPQICQSFALESTYTTEVPFNRNHY